MLSHNQGQYVEESVMSVINQTHKNWELIFLDDNSNDDTIHKMMILKDKAKICIESGVIIDRIIVSHTVYEREDVNNSNSALKVANGKWIAFLNVGDIWSPDKLKKQISFMEKHGYAFSYHLYRIMDDQSQDRGFLIGGKDRVTHKEMLKCCWPGYLTVMYNAEKVGRLKVRSIWTNNYALWLSVSSKNDCYLLKESLATMRTKWKKLGNILLTNNFKWRYDAYRLEEDLGCFISLCYTIRNRWYGIMKWKNYVKRLK